MNQEYTFDYRPPRSGLVAFSVVFIGLCIGLSLLPMSEDARFILWGGLGLIGFIWFYMAAITLSQLYLGPGKLVLMQDRLLLPRNFGKGYRTFLFEQLKNWEHRINKGGEYLRLIPHQGRPVNIAFSWLQPGEDLLFQQALSKATQGRIHLAGAL